MSPDFSLTPVATFDLTLHGLHGVSGERGGELEQDVTRGQDGD